MPAGSNHPRYFRCLPRCAVPRPFDGRPVAWSAALGLLLAWLILAGGGLAEAQLHPRAPQAELSSDIYLDQASNAARSRLEQVKEFLANRQTDEAIETLRRVMENDGDQVIALARPDEPGAAGFQRYVTLRHFGHLRLAEMQRTAPEALALYRNRVDPLASRWFQEAVDERDAAKLARLVDQFFVSSYGDEALYRLGELALERGDYLTARESWERISPRLRAPGLPASPMAADGVLWLPGRPFWLAWRGLPLDEHWPALRAALGPANGEATPAAVPSQDGESEPKGRDDAGRPEAAEVPGGQAAGKGMPGPKSGQDDAPLSGWLAYPDTNLPLADVAARLVLVSLLEGAGERARWELELFARLYPDSEGSLGGKTGRYVELLTSLLEQSRSWPDPPRPDDWPTFGGSAQRQACLERGVDLRHLPLWQAELPVLQANEEYLGAHRPRVAERGNGLLSYHPVVSGGRVFVATGPELDDLQAFDLQTGSALWEGDPQGAKPDGVLDRPRFAPGRLTPGLLQPQRFVGVPRYTLTVDGNQLLARLGSPVTGGGQAAELPTASRSAVVGVDIDAQRKLLYKLTLNRPDWDPRWAFEGTPVSDGQYLYVALRRQDDVRAQMHLACFDPVARKLRWRQLIVSADTLGHGLWNERTHCLLTLSNGMLFVNTNLGVVAAVRAETGAVQWITRYQRAVFRDQAADREDRHFFRDLTPCLLYRDLVIAAPADCDRLFALDAASGQLIWATAPQQATDVVHLLGVGNGNLLVSGDYLYWIRAETGRLLGRFPDAGRDAVHGFGRGLLAGDQVYWPTREAIYVLDQAEPRLTRQPIDLRPLGLTGGNLVAADGVLVVASADRLVAFSESAPGRGAGDAPGRSGRRGSIFNKRSSLQPSPAGRGNHAARQ